MVNGEWLIMGSGTGAELCKGVARKDTLRLLLFLDCNMRCSYCCNEQQQFSSRFVRKRFEDIDLQRYDNICLSGGEPFLHKNILFSTLDKIPLDKKVFIYSNALMINNYDIAKLTGYKNLRCINVGIHTTRQLSAVNKNLEVNLPVRFMVQDTNYKKLMELYPERLNKNNLKKWKLNECDMPNEDWVLLLTAE